MHDALTVTANAKNWPHRYPFPMFKLGADYSKSDQTHATARESAAKIRHALAKQGLPEEEHFFFRQEMYYAAKSAPLPQRPLIWLYWMVSDYGYSVLRPLGWLAVVWALGMVWLTSAAPAGCPAAWEHSLSNSFSFFNYLRTYYPDCAKGLTTGLKSFSGMQTVVSYILLFFLGLGLRQRFRLR